MTRTPMGSSWKSKVEGISWINKGSYFFDFLKLCICWGKNHILHLLNTKHGQQIMMYLRVLSTQYRVHSPTVNLCCLKEYAHAQLVVYQHPYVFFSNFPTAYTRAWGCSSPCAELWISCWISWDYCQPISPACQCPSGQQCQLLVLQHYS